MRERREHIWQEKYYDFDIVRIVVIVGIVGGALIYQSLSKSIFVCTASRWQIVPCQANRLADNAIDP
jgi:uncharacterized membrane protein